MHSPRPLARITTLAMGLAAASAGLLLGASPASATSTAEGGTAWVRATHLVPGLGTMSIGLTPFAGAATDDEPDASGDVPVAPVEGGARQVAPAAQYGKASEYRQVPAGLYTVTVRPAGAGADTPPVLSGTLDAKADQAYTLAALGTKADATIRALQDDLRPPTAGSAKVRLMPAASNAQQVTVTAAGGPTLAEQAVFGRPTGYAEVPAGTWKLTAQGSGGAQNASLTADVSVTAGDVYTLLVLDKPGGGLALTPLLDAAGMGSMPVAGVQTGAGGAALSGTSSQLGAAPLAVVLLAAVGGLLLTGARARRTVRTRS